MDYADLEGPDGQGDNMGGLTKRFFFARVDDFTTIQKPINSPVTPGDTVEIATAHVFKSTKCFLKGYTTLDKGKLTAETQGERDGRSFKITGEVFVPGSEIELHGFAGVSKNDQFIGLFPMPDGQVVQIGTELMPAEITAKWETSTNSGGVRGYTFTFEAMWSRINIYTAAISTTPAP